MGGSSSSTMYTVEFLVGEKRWEQHNETPQFYSEQSANDWIKDRAKKWGRQTSEYRVVPLTYKSPTTVKGDMKEGLTNGKPQLSQLPQAGLIYTARAFEYGCSPTKYERGNYLRPTVDTLTDFDRLLSYLDALLRHATKLTTEMNRARGCTDQTEADLKAAAMCIDKESGLPHLCGMMASGMMAIQQAADAGLIPADPGRPWERK